MAACKFCQIIKRESPASLVFEDPGCLAFMDIQPATPGHLLVIPKKHAAYLSDMDSEEFAQLFAVAHRLAAAVRSSGIPCEGINLILADGEAAGQEIFHVHVHVIPRVSGDGFGFQFGPDYLRPPERGELDARAAQIRAALDSSRRS